MIDIIIGYYGSYNEYNEKSLGSQWLHLDDYETWEEIEKELKKEQYMQLHMNLQSLANVTFFL